MDTRGVPQLTSIVIKSLADGNVLLAQSVVGYLPSLCNLTGTCITETWRLSGGSFAPTTFYIPSTGHKFHNGTWIAPPPTEGAFKKAMSFVYDWLSKTYLKWFGNK